jgi:hypothetical protein
MTARSMSEPILVIAGTLVGIAWDRGAHVDQHPGGGARPLEGAYS